MSNARELAELGGSYGTGGFVGMKNRIINGAMMVAQRGTSFAAAADATYPTDRWKYGANNGAVVTVSQQSDVPTGLGLSYSTRLAVTTADTSIGSTEIATIVQVIEGFNISDLVGVTFTVSFWVRSSKTGTHCVGFRNSGGDRGYPAEYTVNVANTWEQKTITVVGGIPASGTWNFTHGYGLAVNFICAAGSVYQGTANTWNSANALSTSSQVNCLDTVGNIFAITGVQLEKGSTATSFDYRPYGTELALCQRYFIKMAEQAVGAGAIFGTNNYYATVSFPVAMRASPTFAASAQNILQCFSNNAANTSSAINGGTMSTYSADIQVTATGTAGQGAFFRLASGYLQFSSEL